MRERSRCQQEPPGTGGGAKRSPEGLHVASLDVPKGGDSAVIHLIANSWQFCSLYIFLFLYIDTFTWSWTIEYSILKSAFTTDHKHTKTCTSERRS